MQTGQAIRRSARHDVAFRALWCVDASHQSLLKLAAPSGLKDGWIEADCVDFSTGGLGLITTVFVPRPARLRVRLLDPTSPDGGVMVDCACVVRRVVMTDRRPAYHLGCAIAEDDPASQAQMLKFLERLHGDAPA